jgi:hypothetical protein
MSTQQPRASGGSRSPPILRRRQHAPPKVCEFMRVKKSLEAKFGSLWDEKLWGAVS